MDMKRAAEALAALPERDVLALLISRRDGLRKEIEELQGQLSKVEAAIGPDDETKPPRRKKGFRVLAAKTETTPGTTIRQKTGRALGEMVKHIAKLVGAKRADPPVTAEIVAGLRETYPSEYGALDEKTLYGRVSASLSGHRELFRCLGRGDGYVLADGVKVE